VSLNSSAHVEDGNAMMYYLCGGEHTSTLIERIVVAELNLSNYDTGKQSLLMLLLRGRKVK
jgi:hypothetical protein